MTIVNSQLTMLKTILITTFAALGGFLVLLALFVNPLIGLLAAWVARRESAQ